MKKLFLIIVSFLLLSSTNVFAQKFTLNHTISSSGFVLDGQAYQILGEITNNSGKMLSNIQVNVNFYDASGKLLKASNFIDESYELQYSDMQPAESEYLAINTSIPFKFIRFVDKVDGRIARSEVVVTGNQISATTKAVVENFTFSKVVEYGVTTFNVSGDFRCTAGKVYNCYAVLAGLNSSGKIIDIQSIAIDAYEISSGNTVKFSGEFYENEPGVVKIKAYPGYRGDWDEE